MAGTGSVAVEDVDMLRRACTLLRHPASREQTDCGGMDELVLGLERLARALDPTSSERSAARVEVQLLGEIRVWVDGVELDRWRSRTGRSILARLCLAPGRRLSVDELLADVWPDAPFDNARNRVHVAMNRVRRALGSDIVTFDGSGYVLAGEDELSVDVDDLSALLRLARSQADAGRSEAACETLAGALEDRSALLCAGLIGGEWLDRERAVVGWRVLDGLHLLGELAEQVGDHELLRRAGEAALSIDENDEGGHRLLIRFHRSRGRIDLARQQLARCAAVLQRGLGVDPLPETKSLVDVDLPLREAS
ncbi:MAG: BTAD domain-containing putative transcriptional regulator [Actinomycetota bacterium]